VKKPSQWSNPLPHLNAATPNFDVSLPLLLASAVAAENFSTEVESANTALKPLYAKFFDMPAEVLAVNPEAKAISPRIRDLTPP
jgi:hypothetical protein